MARGNWWQLAPCPGEVDLWPACLLPRCTCRCLGSGQAAYYFDCYSPICYYYRILLLIIVLCRLHCFCAPLLFIYLFLKVKFILDRARMLLRTSLPRALARLLCLCASDNQRISVMQMMFLHILCYMIFVIFVYI